MDSKQQTNCNGTTRREFIKHSGAVTSAAVIGSLGLHSRVHAAGSDTIRLGMIGCGGRATGAAAEAMTADPGVRLVAMCDIFMTRVHQKRKLLQDRKGDQVDVPDENCFAGFDGYRQVIEASDVVVIANAAKFHPLHSYAAIQAGRHVFVEKPHGIDPAGLKLMRKTAELAKTKGLCLVSGLQSRYHEGYQETVKRIHDGAIGDVVAIEEHWLRGPYGVIERQPGLTELQWQCSTQYHFRWLSGDDVPQTLVHNLDRSRWVLGDQNPVKCHGMGGRSSMTDPKYGDVFDHHSVVYTFPNGVPVYAYCRTTTGCHNQNSSVILGTKGRASVVRCRITGETNWRYTERSNPYQREHDALFAGIRSGVPVNSGAYMVASTQTVVMGQLACYTGREVSWQQMEESDFYYPPRPEDCHDAMDPPVVKADNGSYPVPVPGSTKML
jgi:predicted dehydrogenase